MKTKKSASRPIDDIKAVYEAGNKPANPAPRPLESIKAVFEQDKKKSKKTKKTKKERRQKSGPLREKIEAFERGNDSSRSLRVSRRPSLELDRWNFETVPTRKSSLLKTSQGAAAPRSSTRDLDKLTFDDLPTRKTSLLQSFALSEKKAEALAHISQKPLMNRRKMSRRASTQRIRVWEDNTAWSYNAEYAAQFTSPQPSEHEDGDKRSTDRRKGLERRHSTGCLGELDAHCDPSSEFWQVYEEDDGKQPIEPMKQGFSRKRGVRFAQHVTVWVFSKESSSPENFDFPQSFLKETSEGERGELSLQRKKVMSEGRFSSGTGGSAPNMPPRRSCSNEKLVRNSADVTASPPKQPQRQLTKRDLHGPKKPQRSVTNDDAIAALKQISSPIKPQRQPTNHDAPASKKYLPSVDLCSSPRKPERKETDHDRNKSFSGLYADFNESRGSKASKATYMYDSFAGDCSETSDTSAYSLDSDSDIQSIDSGMFSAESGPANRYIVDNTRPTDVEQESEECRRERALMWHRRWAMPSYEMMKHHVRVTPGLGISVEDVDLLPWSTTKANYK